MCLLMTCRVQVIYLSLLSLTLGCSSAVTLKARDDVLASKDAYKACLQQHPEEAGAACDNLKKAYEADLLYYTKTTHRPTLPSRSK